MPRIKNTFSAGRMNKDLDSRLIPVGEYRDALNIKLRSSSGADVGAIENVLSNTALSSITLNSNPKTLGTLVDKFSDNIYWWVHDDNEDYLFEYNMNTDAVSTVLNDSRSGSSKVLNFDPDYLITGAGIVVDSDTGNIFLVWTDGLNPIRFINVTTAKTYGQNGFDQADISLIKAPPLSPPTLTLGNTSSQGENTLKDKFLRYATRYHYEDGQISPLSPFTETAFLPQNFSFDYALASNESMVNQYNQATIGFNVGPSTVKKVELVFKNSGSTTVYSIKTFDKEEEGWLDNSDQSFVFSNYTSYSALPEDQLYRLYDNVPLQARALELIGNRLILGNYVEGYDIKDASNDPIKVAFSLDVVRSAITAGTPTQSMKSNRSYEAGVVYMDDFGRMSTVLISDENTVFIPNDACDEQNVLEMTISSLAPVWATRYRVFIKQVQTDYDVIVPSIFYQDGVYVWVRLEADDDNKVNVGDYIYVKSDATKVLESAAQTRVLEITQQEQNFLENEVPDPFEVRQVSGTYMKIKPTDFNLNPESVSIYSYTGSGFRHENASRNFEGNQNYIESAVYYGVSGLNDLTEGGSYTGTDDIRYEIEIFTVGVTDTFRWREYLTGSETFDPPTGWNDNGGLGIDITGSAQSLSNGVTITFGATTGHDSADSWIVSAKSDDRVSATNENTGSPVGDLGRRALMHYKGKSSSDDNGEAILAGAVITLTYDDSRSEGVTDEYGRWQQTFISSSSYANLEEWFFGENILSQLPYPTQGDEVLFRRGSISSGGEVATINPSGDMIMTFSSSAGFSGSASSSRVRTDSVLEIRELDNNIIFETIPPVDGSQFFFEVGKTYTINSSGYHQGSGGSDQNQTGAQDAIIRLPAFNCFSWGNGFESYKWKDAFNGVSMKIDTRPSEVVENYKRSVRISDLTYSGVYEQTTNFNGLNEFNLYNVNFFTDIDDKYGSIQKLYAKDTNLIVFSEDKVHNVPFAKDILFDADGEGTLRQSNNVLGTPRAYAGEYGISTSPESFCFYGNALYFADPKRGAWLRLSGDGITEISDYGMEDFFSDYFRDNPTAKLLGAYDLHDKELVISLQGGGTDYTVAFDESVQGFPSRYSFMPDWMCSHNNKFYSVKNGQLYEHYDESNPVRNTFYGTSYDSTVKFFFNQSPSIIKVARAMTLEGNKAWGVNVRSYLNDETVSITETDRAASDFLNREGQWDVYLESSTVSGDLTGNNAYGLGTVDSVATSVVTLNNTFGSKIAVGDSLYEEDGTLVGIIQSCDRANNTVTVDTTPTIAQGTFVYGLKSARYDGSSIRGYNFEVDLTDETSTRTELFAANLELFQSLPSS